MLNKIVEVKHLSHKYSVDWAIRDINFAIKENGVFGLLGSNGAGKSTTMNIICNVLTQTEGDVFINGINFQSKSDRYFRERSVCVIENAPEAENDNTFILKCDKEHIKALNDFITQR